MHSETDTIYRCDYCGYQNKWDAEDELHGELWSCEDCGKTFCSKCLVDRVGLNGYKRIMQGHGLIKCPDCAEKDLKNV